MPPDVIPILLRVPRRDIAYVKFVIESYEGVAVTRTVDPAAGVVVVGQLETIDVRVSDFMLTPVLAVAERAPVLVPDAREVAAKLEFEPSDKAAHAGPAARPRPAQLGFSPTAS